MVDLSGRLVFGAVCAVCMCFCAYYSLGFTKEGPTARENYDVSVLFPKLCRCRCCCSDWMSKLCAGRAVDHAVLRSHKS